MSLRRNARRTSIGRRMLEFASALLMLGLSVAPFVAPVHAQTQIVTASPGYINLGMTTSIAVTAPSAGTYDVIVSKPNGATSTLPFTFSTSGQTQNATFGSATKGFTAAVNLVGTYNVFVEQGSTVLGSTSFYATNRLVVSMDMVNGGTCVYVPGVTRGVKMFPRFYIYYASNGAMWSNNTAGASINFTLPDKTIAPATWDSGAKLFVGKLYPNWNYTAVGTWSPTATISDAYGNTATYVYTGSPFTISPAQLSTTIQLVDSKTGQTVTSVYSGEVVNLRATITYPTNAEPVSGFVAPLDTASRGGIVSAQVGYGYYNTTTNTFGGSAKNPGTLLATVTMTYTGANGTWTGQYTATSLPALPAGQLYEVVVTSSDKASPPNTGMGTDTFGASLAPGVTSSSSTSTAPPVTSTSTLTSTLTTTAPPVTSTSTLTSTMSQIIQSIPTVAYAGMVILLALGLVIGLILRMRK